jgi:hypothetical protein
MRSHPLHTRIVAPLARVAAVATICVLFSGCPDDSPTDNTTCTVSGVTVVSNRPSVTVGETATINATVGTSDGCGGGVRWSVTPVWGMLTTNGATTAFKATAAGDYTIRATSTDDSTKSGTTTITVTASTSACGQPSGSVVTHVANIAASETWAGDGVIHRVPTSLSITGSAAVTIDPCAIVELGPGVTISVRDNARLVAAGASSLRTVTFRRSDASQAWGTLRGFTATSLIDLRFTLLQGGGGFGGMSDPTIAVSGVGYSSPNAAVLRTKNVTIESSKGVGVLLDANAAFTDDSEGLVIRSSGGRPVHTTMMALGSLPEGTYTGNGIDEILIFGPGASVFADMTVKDHGVPIRLPFGNMYIGPAPPATAPVTLTLRPGVILKFPRLGGVPAARLTFGSNGNAPNNLVGVLNAVGTAARPIVFTSGEETPAPGDWIGIWLNTANGSRLEHVEISYAGGENGIQSNNCRPADTEDQAALLIGSFSDQYIPPANLMTNCRITHSAYYAIDAMWQAPTHNAPDLTATNTFVDNARCRQTFNGVLPPASCPRDGGCTAP